MRTSGLIFLCTIYFCSCRISDHNDQPERLGTDLINIPGSGHEEIPEDEMPRFEFEEDVIDVGEISQGTVVRQTYTFRNAGKRPLLINDVKTTCGCTAGKDWPTSPIPPGDQGTISVSFDSEGKKGMQDKPISIVANTTPETTVLRLKATVVAPE